MWFTLTTMNINIMRSDSQPFVFILTDSTTVTLTISVCVWAGRKGRPGFLILSRCRPLAASGPAAARPHTADTQSHISLISMFYQHLCAYWWFYLFWSKWLFCTGWSDRQAHRKWSRLVFTCPCQSLPFTKIRLSGRVLSDSRIWLSWSYTIFLGICKEECDRKHFLRLAF